MAITSFNDLRLQITRLIDGEDATASTIATETINQIIALGERRIYRDLRHGLNEKAWGLTTTSNAVTLPTDFRAASVAHFGKKPLEPVSEERLLEFLNENRTGDARHFAKAGNTLIFSPAVTDGTTLQGRYYYALPALSATTLPSNALFAENEDLFIYAALVESAPFFDQDNRVPMWNAKYNSILSAMNREHQRGAYSAGRMVRSASTRLMR